MRTVYAVVSETDVDHELGEAHAKYSIPLGEATEDFARYLAEKFYRNPAPGYESVSITEGEFHEPVHEKWKQEFPGNDELIDELVYATRKMTEIRLEFEGWRNQ